MYEVDGTLVTIAYDIINKIRAWNTDMFRNDTNYDVRIVHALMVICIGSDAVAAGRISEKLLKFIKGNIPFGLFWWQI